MASRCARLVLLLTVAGSSACATKSDVDSLRGELAAMRASQDSFVRTLLQIEQSLKTALEEQGNLIAGMRGHVGLQLDDVERQLVQIQELLGQGQIALLGLRERIQRREAERRSSPPVVREDTTERPRAAGTDPEALYNAAIEQLRRGAYTTARSGFSDFLVSFPAHQLAPDAQLHLAETYLEEDELNRALTAFNRVVELYPNSSVAPTALYRAGRVQVERGNKDSACEYFLRVLAGFPRSDESRPARDQANRLNCGR